MDIPASLLKDINSYCEINSIKDTEKFIIKMLRQGFTTEKYGRVPDIPVVNIKLETKSVKMEEISLPIKPLVEEPKQIKTIKKNTDDLYDED